MQPKHIIGQPTPYGNGRLNQLAQDDQPLKISIMGNKPDVERIFRAIAAALPIRQYTIHYAEHPAEDDNGLPAGRMIITRYYLEMEKCQS